MEKYLNEQSRDHRFARGSVCFELKIDYSFTASLPSLCSHGLSAIT